jgi:hypothetical protein
MYIVGCYFTYLAGGTLSSLRESIELVSDKLGVVLVGVMHFGNLYVFSRMRNRAKNPDPPLQQPWPQR